MDEKHYELHLFPVAKLLALKLLFLHNNLRPTSLLDEITAGQDMMRRQLLAPDKDTWVIKLHLCIQPLPPK